MKERFSRLQSQTFDQPIVAVDLFCGAGGLTNGLRRGGIRVAAGIDIDPASQFAFESNNPGSIFLNRAVETLSKEDLDELWSGAAVRLLAGCAPCQPFSTYSQGKNISLDSRWRLLDDFARLVRECLPDYVTMENVPTLSDNAVFDEFVDALAQLGYRVWNEVVDCSNYGVPQARRRLVLIASRLGTEAPRIKPRKGPRKTVRQALAAVRPLAMGAVDPKDRTHRCARLSPLNLRRIQASKPGGTWLDWSPALRCKCHQANSGQGYQAVYGRLEWDAPAPTITTQCYNYGSGRFGHPSQDRPISLREAALLQGFPRSYRFESSTDPLSTRDLSRLVGNAVPPPLGLAIARALTRNRISYV